MTIRAPTSSTAACASSGTNEMQRHVERALPVRAQRLLEDRLGARGELRPLLRLLRERLDDVDADDVLLGDGRDVGELLLDVAQRRVRDVAVAVGEPRRGPA